MKKIYINLLKALLLCFVVIAAGCNDFLDKIPDNRVEVSNVSDIEGLLANALPDACFYSFTHSLSDNAGDGGISGNAPQTNEEAYKFMDFSAEGQDSPLFYWISCYEAIANVNLAIEYIEKLKDNEKEFSKYEHLYGEALVARAYNHFMLVNLFSKKYDPTTAKTDLGIPYVTKPETVVLGDYERKNVDYVYKQIIRDYEKGLPLLNDDLIQQPKYHFTTTSAHAFGSRLYLYLGEWQKVVEHASGIVGNSSSLVLRGWNDEYKNFTSDELRVHYASSRENSNLLIRVGMSSFPNIFKSQRFGLTEPIHRYIYTELVCEGAFSYAYRGYDEPNRRFVEKFHLLFKRTDINAQQGYGYINNPLFTVEEVFFNYLEAKVMQERYPTIIRALNNFFSQRVHNIIDSYNPVHNNVTEKEITTTYQVKGEDLQSWYAINGKQKIFLRCLIHLRRAEFMFEGLRWFDIKRFNIPVIHYDANRNKYVLTADDERKAIQIPASAIALGLKPNPRN